MNILRKQILGAAAFGILSFLVALILSWVFLAPQNFWYGLWHDHTSIGAAIDKYGPQNRYIPGFAETTREQRASAFAEINKAIHRGGEGLADISFDTQSFGRQKLLREPEIAHLQDVADLISLLKFLVLIVIVCWLIIVIRGFKRRRLPSIKQQFWGTTVFVIISASIVFLIGPKKVFNTLHIWVFPKENAWFFYYQDSLMSTLMEAPYLFGWIAAALLFWALIFYFVLQLFTYSIVNSTALRAWLAARRQKRS